MGLKLLFIVKQNPSIPYMFLVYVINSQAVISYRIFSVSKKNNYFNKQEIFLGLPSFHSHKTKALHIALRS